jgi:hypothetical protein
MKILCTFPGKIGDILWAMPTVRAISETYETPVHFRCSNDPRFSSILPLLGQQSYLASAEALPTWSIREEGIAPMSPRVPETIDGASYDLVFHLGYESWPEPSTAINIYRRAAYVAEVPLAALDLQRPWIIPPYDLPKTDLAIGFTDEHFELKYGLYLLIFQQRDRIALVNCSTSPRWRGEGQNTGYTWESTAAWLANATVFLGCCSAMHVLACAVGTPVVLMEPSEARWNEVFYPYGKTGPHVTLVLGGDGRPTFDARHVLDTVRARIAAKRETRHERTVQ